MSSLEPGFRSGVCGSESLLAGPASYGLQNRRGMRRGLRYPVPAFLIFTWLLSSAWGISRGEKDLSAYYREWLTRDVVYIITKEEKDDFLRLVSNQERDAFINRFWELRNPTPNSPQNPYKDEIYRRIAYANQSFGHVSHSEGWRTDMGRVYITLGEPAQRQKLLGLQKITPMEIWFYSKTSPALPPFFYVIFYQRESTDEFRIYHPYSDGPEKLITAAVGSTRQNGLRILTDEAGKDVAKETLSLLPDEPVDFNGGTISLASEVMLATILDLANNPLSKEELNNHRLLLEDVRHRVILAGEEFLDVLTVPLRDRNGSTDLHYLLRLKKPDDFTVGQSAKEGYYYSVLVSAKVQSPDGKLIFSDEKKISKAVSSAEFEDVKGKVFGYEGLLPLPPGQYKVDFALTNLLSNMAFQRRIEVTIPVIPASGLQVSGIVPFVSARTVDQRAPGTQPFTGAGVQFIPRVGDELDLTQGEPLRFFYQVWAPSLVSLANSERKIELEYVYGRMGTHDTKTISDQLPLNQLDKAGSVINGKQILTADLPLGHYRLVMTLRDPESQAKVYRSLNFSISSTTSAAPSWDITAGDSAASGEEDWQRASCYLAEGKKAQAIDWVRSAYSKDPANERFRDQLIELYFEREEYAKAVEVYGQSGLGALTDEHAVVEIAESFSRLGNLPKAVAVLESGTTLNPKSAVLQLALADYYRKSGNLEKAAAAERKGKKLMTAGPAS
jgi:GWxTD domain-containing protein